MYNINDLWWWFSGGLWHESSWLSGVTGLVGHLPIDAHVGCPSDLAAPLLTDIV
jgi:hypothetical protein